MKLIIVLSLVAYGYSDKLDRTYLPPANAATAGGSPGSITAPGPNAGPFGKGPSTGGSAGLNLPFGTSPGSNAGSFGKEPSNISGGAAGPNQPFGQSATANFPGGSGSQNLKETGRFPDSSSSFGTPNFGAQSQPSGESQARPTFGQGSNFGPNAQSGSFPQTQQPERPQAEADRNAEILKYVNENDGESYYYSYETSNGISAEESGVATNGVRAQGGFSYTGDDGKPYSVTYTADENGFQPQGEHLPTPPPIPDEILKSIEQNAQAAAAGTQEGAYRPDEYDSESPQQYNTGSTGSRQPSGQGFASSTQGQKQQGQANQPQQNTQGSVFGKLQGQDNNGYNYNQPQAGAQKPSLQGSGQFSGPRTPQAGPQQQPQGTGNAFNKITGPQTRPTSGQFGQPQQPTSGFKNPFGNQQGPTNQPSQGQRGQAGSGYNYDQPQKNTQGNQFPSSGSQSQQSPQSIGSSGTGPQTSPSAGQFNQRQQPSQGPTSQALQGQRGQGQNGNGYNYDQPQRPSQGASQFPSFGSQSQKSPQNFGNSANVAGSQTRPTSQFNQPQQPTQGQRVQGQSGNGYNYDQPQRPSQGSSQFPGFGTQSQKSPQDIGSSANVPGSQPKPSTGLFNGRQPTQSFGNQQGPMIGQGPRDQGQSGNGYNYDRPQGPNQFSGSRPQTQPQTPQGTKINGKGIAGQQQGQINGKFNQPQQPGQQPSIFGTQQSRPQNAQGIDRNDMPSGPQTPSAGKFGSAQQGTSGFPSQQSQSNRYPGQAQDQNGYQYNRPQSNQNTPTLGSSGQNRPAFGGQKPGFPASSGSPTDFGSRPNQYSPSSQGAGQSTRPFGTTGQFGTSQGPSGSPSNGGSQFGPGKTGPEGSSRPDSPFQPSLSPAPAFRPQGNAPSNQVGSGKPSAFPSQSTQSKDDGYQYSRPGQTSQSQRPGFNSGNQGFNGGSTPNRGQARPEFEGPRQPPSFSPEEGYKY